MIKWTHILDKQPTDKMIIVQIHNPFDMYDGEFKKHYTMGMYEWHEFLPWSEYLEYCTKHNTLFLLNYWWIDARDFPFPDKE